ncbi:hypothetical protein PR048_021577 [Dryococelus australis]|uniref:PiggyBac transposable element-derived protein domain-containing protein n=1 Tax=Dryococelus australis TaxID=614101 RepID=A0ABQ9GYN2_9NEOP|nr:hypothetical protein PR048_021577 [Dryococelus australis]
MQVKMPCPNALDDYNSNMNCIDKFDQMKGTYEIDRKSKKWWHRIFLRTLVSIAFVSSRAQKKRQSANVSVYKVWLPNQNVLQDEDVQSAAQKPVKLELNGSVQRAKCLCVWEKQNLASNTTTDRTNMFNKELQPVKKSLPSDYLYKKFDSLEEHYHLSEAGIKAVKKPLFDLGEQCFAYLDLYIVLEKVKIIFNSKPLMFYMCVQQIFVICPYSRQVIL